MSLNRDVVFHLTNEQRRKHDRRSFKRSALLNRSAGAKARRLAKTGKLEHGMWWKLIFKVTGMKDGIGENIADGQHTPADVVEAWMNSPEHRHNILDVPGYRTLGVGCYVDRNGRAWWVQHFGWR
jgi:uncharacterized protein YkwD